LIVMRRVTSGNGLPQPHFAAGGVHVQSIVMMPSPDDEAWATELRTRGQR
jgi:hypothetical protein